MVYLLLLPLLCEEQSSSKLHLLYIAIPTNTMCYFIMAPKRSSIWSSTGFHSEAFGTSVQTWQGSVPTALTGCHPAVPLGDRAAILPQPHMSFSAMFYHFFHLEKVTSPPTQPQIVKIHWFQRQIRRKVHHHWKLARIKDGEKQAHSAASNICYSPFLMLSIRTGNPDCAAAINFKAM